MTLGKALGSLVPNFLICKMEIIILATVRDCRRSGTVSTAVQAWPIVM